MTGIGLSHNWRLQPMKSNATAAPAATIPARPTIHHMRRLGRLSGASPSVELTPLAGTGSAPMGSDLVDDYAIALAIDGDIDRLLGDVL